MQNSGRSLELYFVDGRPDGMLTAEIFNWTGYVLMTPRTQLKAALSREETKYTGIYILLGEKDGDFHAYIGESEDVSQRIRDHDSKKDWWDKAIIVTSSANNLHKAHVKYLEARLVEDAKLVGTVKLDNGNTPTGSGLSEAARANMEHFLDMLKIALPALRVDMFVNKTRSHETPTASNNNSIEDVNFYFSINRHNINAKAVLRAGEFIVLAGSNAKGGQWNQTDRNGRPTSYGKLHGELIDKGILELSENSNSTFTMDYAFQSTSAAAAIVAGRASRGPTEWKLEDGTIYADWEARELSQSN